ncbi:MAG: ATP-binding protein [Motiliproteus sp.]
MLTTNQKVTALGVLWAAVTLVFIFLLLMLDVSRHRERLQLESSVIYEYAYERALINEVLLRNFVALVENDLNDRSAIQHYASEMREHYPHISYFLLYERVDAEKVAELESKMISQGLEGFNIRLHGGDLSGAQVTGSEQSFFYPATFVEPKTVETRKLLGLDGYSIEANRMAMMKTSYYLDVFASKAYPMESGEMGYRLFHTIDPALYGDQEDGRQIASLVVKANTLLPPRPQVQDRLDIVLTDGLGNRLAYRRSYIEASWMSNQLFPLIEERRSIDRFGQTLELVVRKQVFFSEVSWLTSFMVGVFSLVAFLLTYQNYRRRKEAQLELEKLNDKLVYERDLLEERVQERTWELVKTNSDLRDQVKSNRSLTQKIISIQEEERRNLARELHDEMGQSLTAIRMDARLLKGATDEKTQAVEYQAVESIDNIAQRIYGVTYGLMRALRPAALDDLGLTDALSECVANAHLKSAGIDIQTEFHGSLNEMPERVNIGCYRLLQEALNNCVKHSGATAIQLSVTREESPDQLLISIKDNGCGFDPDNNGSGFGIIGMRERVYGLDGSFNITSAPGKGALIQASIPIV